MRHNGNKHLHLINSKMNITRFIILKNEWIYLYPFQYFLPPMVNTHHVPGRSFQSAKKQADEVFRRTHGWRMKLKPCLHCEPHPLKSESSLTCIYTYWPTSNLLKLHWFPWAFYAIFWLDSSRFCDGVLPVTYKCLISCNFILPNWQKLKEPPLSPVN